MTQEKVHCNSCGASLQIASGVNFVTCASCGSALAVRRSGSSVYTEPTGSSTDIAPEPHSPVRGQGHDHRTELNRLENQLNRLDIDWDRKKEEFMLTGRYGHRSIPTKASGYGVAIVATIAGILWSVIAFGVTSGFTWSLSEEVFGPPPIVRILVPLFGLVFAAFGIGMGVHAYSKAARYEQAHAKYQLERSRLEAQIRLHGG